MSKSARRDTSEETRDRCRNETNDAGGEMKESRFRSEEQEIQVVVVSLRHRATVRNLVSAAA